MLELCHAPLSCACEPSLMIGTALYSLYATLLALVGLLTRLTTGGKQEKAMVGVDSQSILLPHH